MLCFFSNGTSGVVVVEQLFFDGIVITGKFCVGVPLNIQSIYLSMIVERLSDRSIFFPWWSVATLPLSLVSLQFCL